MTTINVTAANVRPGDELYNGGRGAPCYWWVRVKSVTPLPGHMVEIETVSWLTRKHQGEGVTVRRDIAAPAVPQGGE